MKRMWTVIFVCGFLVFGVNTAQAQLPASVKMGVATPLTGALAMNGAEVKEGADLAAELVNKAGGIKGKTKIELIYADDRCSPTDAVNVTQRLLTQGVDYYLGNYCSSAALATMPILATDGIPQVVLAYAPSITAEARTANSVRIGPSAGWQMAPLAKYAIQVNKDKTFAAVAVNNDFGRAMAEEFGKAAERLGGKVTDYQYYPFGADFSTYLTKVKNMNVNGILVIAMGNDTISFTKSYYELGLKNNIYGGDNFVDSQYVEKQKPKPATLFYAELYDDDSPRAPGMPAPEPWIKDFVKAFQAKYGKEPTRNNVWGYASVTIMAQAIEAIGTTDKKKISDYLHSGAAFKSPLGEFGFAWCGQAHNRSLIGKFEGDKKFFLKEKKWGDDALPDACPPK